MEDKVSRQYQWQLRKLAEGNCRTCGKTATTKFFCRKCANAVYLRAKKKHVK